MRSKLLTALGPAVCRLTCVKGFLTRSRYWLNPSEGSVVDASHMTHGAYVLVFEPQVETAVWAIVAAVGCALVLVLSEMVKKRK